MAKTTIDGLRVRESSAKRQVVDSARSTSTHVVDMTTRPATRQNMSTTPQRQEMLNSIQNIRRKQSSRGNEFLDPVETFDFDAEPGTMSGEEVDWSDLLDNLESDSPSTNMGVESFDDGEEFLSGRTDRVSREDFLGSTLNEGEENSEEPETRPAKKVRRHKKRHIGRMVAIAMVCLVVIGGGVFYKWGDELISRLTNGNSGLFDAIHSMLSDAVPFEMDENGRTNVLIFGTEGYNMNGDTAYGGHDGAQLTDSIMVASFDQETKDVALLSLPRDLKVSMACSAGKINEVFWCNNPDGNDEEAGAKALMRQVSDILGIKMQYYAHINWASLIDIIDTLGGITVTLDEDINDYGWTNAVAQAGVPMQVDGVAALGLARARHGTQGGDFTRGNTQQKIVEGIVNKVLENGVGVTEAINLMNILGDNLRSNFSTDNIKAGVRMISGFSVANIRQVPLVDYNTNTFYVTSTTINNISYVVPMAGNSDYSEIRKYVAEMFSSDPTAREDARIIVYNASGKMGAAAKEREALQADGYDVVGVGDATLGSCGDRYCLYAVNENFPATQVALAERYGVTILPASELPEDIEPGETDFVLLLGLDGSEA